MILRRIADGLRRQDWATVFIELLVVVVGLLLGLELNNWSNNVKDRRVVEGYYDQIILDLETDIGTGEKGIRSADRSALLGNIVLRAATQESVDDVSDGDLVQALVVAGYAERPLITRHTYDELINTGSLSLIEDTEVKRALGVYYSRAEYGRQWDALIQHEQMRYRDAIRGILTPDQMRWVRESLGGDTGPPPDFDRNQFLHSVQERPEIVDSLASMAAVHARLKRNSERIAAYASEMIEVVSK